MVIKHHFDIMTEFIHKVELPRDENNLKVVANCATILNKMSCKLRRDYITEYNPEKHIYLFKNQEIANLFNEKLYYWLEHVKQISNIQK